ncbi:hypothetical protein HOP50_05g37870 [Chloropicon primus]|nr:hypothetical protein HOP50_05g37870 [Chloropicon primus]
MSRYNATTTGRGTGGVVVVVFGRSGATTKREACSPSFSCSRGASSCHTGGPSRAFDVAVGARRRVRAEAKSRPLRPDDSPLRDGNRDRLLGLLTERAAKTLLQYCSETNQHLYHWLTDYIKQNPIPRDGQFQDVSGETFLVNLMLAPAVEARAQPWLDPLFDCSKPLTVDPRNVAQRIMDIRVALSKEFQEDLNRIDEENMDLLRSSLMVSLEAKTYSHPIVPDPEDVEKNATEEEGGESAQ